MFERYSWRVRELIHVGFESEFDISDTVFMDISMATRTFSSGGELLPNLRHFESDAIGSLQKWIHLFIHKTIDSLTLIVPGLADTDIFM